MKLHMLKIYSLVPSNVSIDLWNHHYVQNSEYTLHPQKYFVPLCNPYTLPTLPNPKVVNYSQILSLEVSLQFPQL